MAVQQNNHPDNTSKTPLSQNLPDINTLKTSMQTNTTTLYNTLTNKLDTILPPSKRTSLKETLQKFTHERPLLSSFLFAHLALSGFPIFLFLATTITVSIISLITGLLVGIIGALTFVVFSICVSMFFLLPVLFFTTGAAVFIWFWGIFAYFVVGLVRQKRVPGVHRPLKEGVLEIVGSKDDGLEGAKQTEETQEVHGKEGFNGLHGTKGKINGLEPNGTDDKNSVANSVQVQEDILGAANIQPLKEDEMMHRLKYEMSL